MAEADIVLHDDADQGLVTRERGNGVTICIDVGRLAGEIDHHCAVFTNQYIVEVSKVNLRLLAARARFAGIAEVRSIG